MSDGSLGNDALFRQIRALSNPLLSDDDYVRLLADVAAEHASAALVTGFRLEEDGLKLLFGSSAEQIEQTEELFECVSTLSEAVESVLQSKSAVAVRVSDEKRVRKLIAKVTDAASTTDDGESPEPNHSTRRFAEHPIGDCPLQLFLVPVSHTDKVPVMLGLVTGQIPEESIAVHTAQLTSLALSGRTRKTEVDNRRLKKERKQLRTQYSMAQENESASERALGLAGHVTAGLEKERACFLLANEIKTYLEVDRVTVVDKRGSTTRIIAVSGQPTINRRANIIRRTQQLAKTLLVAEEPVWFNGEVDNFAQSIRSVLSVYLAEAMTQGFVLLPIIESTPPVYASEQESLIEIVNQGRTHRKKVRGAILLENLNAPIDQEKIEKRWSKIEPLVNNHFNNVKRYSDLFLLPLTLLLTKFFAFYRGHTRRKAIAITGLLVIGLLLGVFVQTDFRVRCEGYLRPRTSFKAFVKKGGVVTEVLIKEGEPVRAGQSLIRLDNPTLEIELAQLVGDRERRRKRLKNLVFERSTFALGDVPGEQERYANLPKETELLESEIRMLDRKIGLSHKQQEELVIRSPFDGVVVGWNIDRKFLNRPLREGTHLFTVTNLDQGRVLELKVPDRRSGHIQEAYASHQESGKVLPIEFTIASNPSERFEGTVVHVNPGLEKDIDLGYVLPVEAIPSERLPDHLRSGLPVAAKVICGRRSYLYCKCYELIDSFYGFVFKYL